MTYITSIITHTSTLQRYCKKYLVHFCFHQGHKRLSHRWKSRVCLTHSTSLPPSLYGLSCSLHHSSCLERQIMLPSHPSHTSAKGGPQCISIWCHGPLTKWQYLTSLVWDQVVSSGLIQLGLEPAFKSLCVVWKKSNERCRWVALGGMWDWEIMEPHTF